MAKKDTKDLLKFIKPYPKEVQEVALWMRNFVWDLYPDCNELIYDNYNAVAFGWSPTHTLGDTFCSIALASKYCHFGFYWGSKLTDPEKLLLGNGKQYRYIKVNTLADFPEKYTKTLLKEAYSNSLANMKPQKEVMKGTTIVKSVSPVKKRPGVAPAKKKK